jgi:hypothetical protein
MPKVRLLVPLADPLVEGNTFAAGEVIDVSDEQVAAWKADGKISVIADEEAAEKMASEGGHYSDVTGRDETEPLEDEDVRDLPKKGKK